MTKRVSDEQFWQWDKDHFIHPYTDFATFKEEGSQVFTEASGAYVHDAQGNQYLDGIAGLWCVNIGHGREEMAEAIRDQVVKLQYCNPFGHHSNEPASQLAAKLAELAPGSLNHVFYTSSGSASNDIAVRLAHYYFQMKGKPSKKKIISRVNAYHGSTYFAANLTGIQATKQGFNTLADDLISHVSAANMYRKPDTMKESEFCNFLVSEFEHRIEQLGADNIAAFIAEPVMGAGGVLVAPKNYHQRIHQLCKHHDILYIADEVVTGFGRLGHWFASEDVFDHCPDILVTAKGINSGYIPLGAALFSDEIYSVISQPQCEGGSLSLGFTYSGHAVACVAALKNIEIMEREEMFANVREVGPYLHNVLRSLLDLPIVGDVRGNQFMAGIELVSDKQEKIAFDAGVNVASRVYKRCLNRGLIIRPIGNIAVLSPPLILTTEHCDTILDVLYHSINETMAELKVAGLFQE